MHLEDVHSLLLDTIKIMETVKNQAAESPCIFGCDYDSSYSKWMPTVEHGDKFLPEDSFDKDENFFPGSVSARLPIHNGIFEHFLQALHIYSQREHDSIKDLC